TEIVLQSRLEEILQAKQQRTFVVRQILQSECRSDHAQQIGTLELGRDDMRGQDTLRIDRGAQSLDERRLAGANFAGDDDETFPAADAVGQIGHRLGVHAAFEIEPVIWCEQERLTVKTVELRVHLLRGSTAAIYRHRAFRDIKTSERSCLRCSSSN